MDSETPSQRILDFGSLDIASIWGVLKRRWPIVLAVPAVFFALTVLFLHFATYQYEVSLAVAPAPQTAPIADMSSLNRLAGLAGIGMSDSSQASPFELYQKGLYLRFAADALAAQRPDIMRRIFSDQWSDAEHKWVEPDNFAANLKRNFKAGLGLPTIAWEPPSGSQLQYYITMHVQVVREQRGPLGANFSPVIQIKTTDVPPDLAIDLLGALHSVVDASLRQRSLLRATSNIDYLKRQLDLTSTADLRNALISAITEQEKLRMQASANVPFAAEPLGSPARSLLPVSPNVTLLLALSVLIGLAGGGLLAFFYDRRRSRSAPFVAAVSSSSAG